jgi:hypothetical protein
VLIRVIRGLKESACGFKDNEKDMCFLSNFINQ